jgi:hypothetical protein
VSKWLTSIEVRFPFGRNKVLLWDDARIPKMRHSAGPKHQHYYGLVYQHYLLPMFKPFPGKWRMRCRKIKKAGSDE